jgi:hypothetical protein
MASNTGTNNKLRVLLIPFFATSHIQPFTELAIRLAAANDAVEATVAVTPASVPIVRSLLHREQQNAAVKIATYPFPRVDGIPKGVENLGTAATPAESLRMQAAAMSEPLTRPAQETLIRAQSPDAIVTDMLFVWNGSVADELGVPCVAFSVFGAFSLLAMRHLADGDVGGGGDDDAVVEVPRFPAPRIRIPWPELPEFLRRHEHEHSDSCRSLLAGCFGFAMNTASELEK